MGARIKKGDNVVVIAGRDRNARGEVLRILSDGRLLVQGINKVKRHQKPTPRMQQGGIIEKEAPIQASNVMLVDPKTDAPTRVRAGTGKDGRKVRVTVKSGAVLDG